MRTAKSPAERSAAASELASTPKTKRRKTATPASEPSGSAANGRAN